MHTHDIWSRDIGIGTLSVRDKTRQIGGKGSTYEFAALLEDACDSLLAWNILPDLTETSHEIEQLLKGDDDFAILAQRFLRTT